MLVRTQTTIQLKEGVTVKLLLTPALYGVARERGIDFTTPPTEGADKQARTLDQYAKIAYCAAILAWEVDAVDDPGKGDFPYTFADFHLWSYDRPKEFGKTIDAILLALTGKHVRDYVKEGASVEKKKTRKGSPFRWITTKLKRSS